MVLHQGRKEGTQEPARVAASTLPASEQWFCHANVSKIPEGKNMSWQDEYRDFFALTEIEVVAKRKAFILEYVHTPLKPRLFKRNAGVSEDALAVVRPRRANAPSNLQETVHTSGPRCGTVRGGPGRGHAW
mmetsp:Transcript_39644/g.98020  ORF Transcript_39644/g.98020 Transcript_39644/m.98020 type:complete len:131 (+) Transcript_39644:84-476(+)